MSTEIKCSPAIRALSLGAHRALLRIMIEHENHSLQENGKLIVTYDDFVEYGIRRERIKPALDQLEFFGLIRINRGRAGNGTPHPNSYRLTWIGDCEHNSPTHEWKATDEAKIKSWEKNRAHKRASKGQKLWQ